MKVTKEKECFCHTCNREFHYLGINRHRAMHREKKQNCTITYTHGNTLSFEFSKPKCERTPDSTHNYINRKCVYCKRFKKDIETPKATISLHSYPIV